MMSLAELGLGYNFNLINFNFTLASEIMEISLGLLA